MASRSSASERARWIIGGGVLVALLTLAPVARAGPAVNDPLFAEQWALNRINAPDAWARSTGAGVLIGVVDSGVDLSHEDLAGKVAASVNCVGSDGDPAHCAGSAQDDDGHGTHVSGIAAADTKNGKGVAAVAPGAGLVVAKALANANGQEQGTVADITAGIEWVVNHGARVVNLSLGSDIQLVSGVLGGDSSLSSGIEYAWQHGAVPVIASGNSTFLSTANYGSIDALVVGATGPQDEVASYSSSMGSAKWQLVAPGGDDATSACAAASQCIVSTYFDPGQPDNHAGYALLDGTSMAAPHVAGVLALLLALHLSPQQAVNAVLAGADKRVSCGPACAGRLDAAGAMAAAGAGSPALAPLRQAAPPSRPAAPARVGTATMPLAHAGPPLALTGSGGPSSAFPPRRDAPTHNLGTAASPTAAPVRSPRDSGHGRFWASAAIAAALVAAVLAGVNRLVRRTRLNPDGVG